MNGDDVTRSSYVTWYFNVTRSRVVTQPCNVRFYDVTWVVTSRSVLTSVFLTSRDISGADTENKRRTMSLSSETLLTVPGGIVSPPITPKKTDTVSQLYNYPIIINYYQLYK